MGKINVLDFEIANLIAAGEVVERPSSVMKELIENAIDAGADKIVAEIKRGGVALIRVSDNGHGMEREDLPVSLKRHATSKIRTRDDLDGISTLGFRGEALAAISSVSEVTIITKTAASDTAYMLTSEGGRIVDISEVGASDGTTVVVENLFFNVPARRKFLKKDSTEAMNVAALVEKVALSRPDISIQLIIDGAQRFKTAGDGDLHSAIYAVLGKDFASKLIAADGTANGIRVHGFIGRSDNVKKNRNLQNIFINGRYVKSLTAMAAVEKAYTSYIAPEAFPACVLFLEINPKDVDVNVHPAKLEVKFANEQPVFEAVYYTVKSALEQHEYRPELTLGGARSERNPAAAFVPIGEDTRGKQLSFNTSVSRPTTPPAITRTTYNGSRQSVGEGSLRVSSSASDGFSRNFERRAEPIPAPTMTPRSSVELLERYAEAKAEQPPVQTPVINEPAVIVEDKVAAEFRIIGEAFDCYVMVEQGDALLVIDKHAAHERVIFEQLKADREADGRVASQTLMLPITAILTPDEQSAAADFRDELTSVGFEYELLDGRADITAIPDALSAEDAEGLFVKMTDELASGRGNPDTTESIRRERALYQIACKAAIKGGRKYDAAVVEWLVGKVLSIPDITVCPHGRPIAYKLTKRELDRQFDRIK